MKADSIGCYGSEFDVWLTSDGQLVVNHDDTFKGVTFQDATAARCMAIRLDNGEQVPTLYQRRCITTVVSLSSRKRHFP